MEGLDRSVATWKCALCGVGKPWTLSKVALLHAYKGQQVPPGELICDHAPYVVTLADGKEYGFCSRECIQTKAILVGLEAIVSRLKQEEP